MKKVIGFLLVILFVSNLYSQQSRRGDKHEIKDGLLKSNSVTTSLYNYGSLSFPNALANIQDMVWKGLGYMFEFGIIVAARVVDKQGETIVITDDSFVRMTDGNYSPDGSMKWGWLPEAGYSNPNQSKLATKNNPSSWPVDWSSWKYENADDTSSLNEAYYVINDFSNVKWAYYPFNDTTKRGLGLKAEVRVYQYGGALKDALVVKYKLTNVSPNNLNEVYFGFQGDPHIGGYTDYIDDMVHVFGLNNTTEDTKYSHAKNTIYAWDENGIGMGGKRTGYMSFKLLKTPDNKDLTSFHAAQFGPLNLPKNSELMWNWLSGGIDTINNSYSTAIDNIINFGSGPFSLAGGETKEIELAIFFSDNYDDMKNDAVAVYFHNNWTTIGSKVGESGGDNNYRVVLTSQNSGEFKGEVPITWTYSGTDPNAKLLLESSSDRGKSWTLLGWDIPVDSTFMWNTSNHKDGVNYVIRAVAYNPSSLIQFYYALSSNKFTVNNAGNAQPEIEFTTDFTNAVIIQKTIDVTWLAEDADNSELNIALECARNISGPFTQLIKNNYSTGNTSFVWDVSAFPNAAGYYLKITASDGVVDTSFVTGPFEIDYAEKSYFSDNIFHAKGNATASFYLQEVDTANTTNDTYEITFTTDNTTQKKAKIKNVNTGSEVLSNFLIQEGVSTPLFDGLKLKITDTPTGINIEKTKFTRSGLESVVQILYPPLIGTPRTQVPNDWIIVFNDLDTLADGSFVHPTDTVNAPTSAMKVIVPFKIFNVTAGLPAQYIIYPLSKIQNLSPWKFNQPVILQPQGATGSATTYQINFNSYAANLPQKGDTLQIITDKEITPDDVFRFAVGDDSIITSIKKDFTPYSYQLYQNYPNPFNPTTTINYTIPVAGLVHFTVYDVLGKEINKLTTEFKQAGNYKVNFDASGLASGVYFYSVRVNNYFAVKKMMLLK